MSRPLISLSAQGLWCEAGGFHIDPWKPVNEAIITHVHSDHARPGSRRYGCAPSSMALMDERIPRSETYALPYGEKRKFGKTWVSLHPAGHILGSAQVRVECGSEVWVASGDYKRDQDPTCEPFEVVPCDTFISEATFGMPIYRWPGMGEVARQILDWWQQCRDEKRAAVLFCYSLGKAQRVLAELGRLTDQEVLVHPTIEALNAPYRDWGVAMVPTREAPPSRDPKAFAGRLVLAPPGTAASAWLRQFGDCSRGFASGWMQVRANRGRRGYDRGFVVSDHADWPGLVRTALETGARTILTQHGSADTLARALREQHGLDARTLESGAAS